MEKERDLKYIPGMTMTKGEPGVVKALRKVYNKMCQLESEKQQAKENYNYFSSKKDAEVQTLIALKNQVSSSESRCKLLELQLRHLRNCLAPFLNKTAEDENITEVKIAHSPNESYVSKYYSRRTVSKSPELFRNSSDKESEKDRVKKSDVLKDIPKLHKLEKYYPKEVLSSDNEITKDTAEGFLSSSLAESSNIDAQKLKKRHPTKESENMISKILLDINKGKKKLSRHPYSKSVGKASKIRARESINVPFILGKSASKSYSLPANIQHVLALLKTYNIKLPGSQNDTEIVKSYWLHTQSALANIDKFAKKYGKGLNSLRQDIRDVIAQLEEEKCELIESYERCQKLISDVNNEKLTEELKPELNNINHQLHSKKKQIEQLTALLYMLGSTTRQKRYRTQSTTIRKDKPGHVYVTTEILTRPRSKTVEIQTSTKVSKMLEFSEDPAVNPNRRLLQELRNIQQNLKKNK
ncbi:centrosomal protein cep57l1-like isoform X1 [Centruroides vittatus]|uniref:centrosomal protein cep57l1-like isoform X1 n=2 Tax=Centruroides vittatus TaxID=120091 RepID=UPI003510181F